jgi:putative ABC transport system permease protein
MQLDSWLGDLRFAWRNAIGRPAFTALVVLTLALGIGVNSAVFALVDAVLIRPLPYEDPSRLVFVWQTLARESVFELEATPFDYAAWHRIRSFTSVALIDSDAFTLTDGNTPERVRGSRVTASLMPLLGIAPQLGRAFTPDEDADSAAPVVIVGHDLWRRRYGADAGIVGRSIRVNGVLHTVVGVMGKGASLPGPLAGDDELWLPVRMAAAERDNAISHNYSVVARLAAGVSLDSASAELEAFAERMVTEHPDTHRNLGARLISFTEQTTRTIKPTLVVVAGGVSLLLLVACANASTLLIVRAASRRHETAIRAALGAGRTHLLSLAVAENTMFAVLGSVAGLAIARWTLQGVLPLFSGSLPPALPIEIGGRVAVYTIAVSAALGVALGVIVAAHRPDRLAEMLRAGSRTTAGQSAARARNALVVAQVALAVVLLSAGGLMTASVAKLSRVTAGFDPGHLLTFRLSLSGTAYDADAKRAAFGRALIERLRATPGVIDAAITSAIPFGGARRATGVEIEGRPRRPGEGLIIDQRHVTPDYFRTMKIPIASGRRFTDSDDDRAERVVVINRWMAARYWPNESPIDRRVRVSVGYDSGTWFRIVGVVDNVRHIALSRDPVSEMYHPYAQAAVDPVVVAVRTEANPMSALPSAREAIRELDSSLPLYDVRSMETRVAGSFEQTRGTMILLVVTATLAAVLAAVAIYGSIWYSVTQRVPEIGIRLALGASRLSVCRFVIGGAVSLTFAGALLGTLVSLAAGPLIRSLLFDTRTTDPLTYGMVIAAVIALTLVASIAPARRAMHVDPMIALRDS